MFFIDYDKEFWVRDKQILNSFRALSQSTTLKAQFEKEGRIFKRPTIRWYFLIDNYLLYSKEDDISSVKGVIDLTFTYVEFEGGFIFSRNIHRLHLKSQSLFEVCIWEEKLRRVCILRNFTKEFILEEKIGQGKFSEVHRCIKKKDQEVQAVKIFSKKLLFQKDTLNAFKCEVRCLRNLNDTKRILDLKYVYEEDQIFYLVTEHLAGGELKYKENESLKTLQSIMKNLLIGLTSIHERGIMHRDIKPANIVLRGAPDDVVIIDFGLATFFDQKTQQVLKCGTPGFVAPEVLNHIEGKKIYNEKCDIYSLGITFYILLYGFNPFQDTEKTASIKKNAEGRINFPKNSKVPPLAQNLLSQMLHKFPKERVSAQQALNHPFFQEESGVNTPNKQSQSFNTNTENSRQISNQQVQDRSSQLDCNIKSSPRSYHDVKFRVYASCDGQFKSLSIKSSMKGSNKRKNKFSSETQDPDWPIPDVESPQKLEQFIIKVRTNTMRVRPQKQL